MADYWKSQGRKFCDFCKCWIADNKPSIEFHESGKKHKENVKNRLKEIHKNSAKQAKITRKFENDIKSMENAAMAAYLKDVEGNTVDLTAQQLIRDKHKRREEPTAPVDNPNRMPDATPETNPRHKASKNFPANVDFLDPKPFVAEYKTQGKAQGKPNKEQRKRKNTREVDHSSKKVVRKAWYEATSPEGYTYYWHVDTNETCWDPPEEGFMTFAEQEEEVKEQQIQAQLLEQIEQEEAVEKAEIFEEQRANNEREKLKEIRKKFKKNQEKHNDESEVSTNSQKDRSDNEKRKEEEEEEKKEEIPYRRDYSLPEKVDPYGPWQTVEVAPKLIDLQLPKTKNVPQVVKTKFEPPVPQRTFQEKTVTRIAGDSDDESSSTTIFKKRKFGNRNMRKRCDDD